MSENKITIDTAGMSNTIQALKTEYDKYTLSADNLSKEVEDIANAWNGPDAEVYLTKFREEIKKVQLLKLTLSDYITAIENLCNKIDNHSGY